MRAVVVIGALLIVVAAASGPAWADAGVVELNTDRRDDIRWVEADVTVPEAEHLRIKILAPKRSGYELFQVCRFPFTGPGRYSCGFDVSEGAIAHKYRGEWLARAVLDGERRARIKFHL